MRTWDLNAGLVLKAGDQLELRVVDLSFARAFYEGIPVARLLARMQVRSDERDLDAAPTKATASSWDLLLQRLAEGAPETAERVKRAIARHTRAAFDEGPLPVDESCVASLVFALAASDDPDASPSEAFGFAANEAAKLALTAGWVAGDNAGSPRLARACSLFEPRLASRGTDRRAVLFEACARLATRTTAGPWPAERVTGAFAELAGSELGASLRRSNAAFFPIAFDADVPLADRRMVLLERAELDTLVAKDPRELASAIARSERAHSRSAHVDTLVADLAALLARPGDLVLAARGPHLDEAVPLPSSRPSWGPADWSVPDVVSALAEAVERGATTIPRLRGLVARGGEPALDAIGAEMLRVATHPFASATFAEFVARSGRPRDVMRLVTYFAIAPDPTDAARALSACVSPELPSVLRAWLEAMLPSDGGVAPFGENPETSSAARLTACVTSLAPYPKLYGAVRPLLARVSEAPPPEGTAL